jgi:hypothetical protein
VEAGAEAEADVDIHRAPAWPGQCSSRWRPGSGRSEHGHAAAGQRRRVRQWRVLGGRGVADGEGARGRCRWGQRPALGGCVGWVRTASVARRGRMVVGWGGGWVEAGARWVVGTRSWRRGSESSERERGKGA